MRKKYRIITAVYLIGVTIFLFFLKQADSYKQWFLLFTIGYYIVSAYEIFFQIRSGKEDPFVPISNIFFINLLLQALWPF